MNKMSVRNVIYVCLILSVTSIAHAEYVIDDFESYANTSELLGVWAERNTAVGTITLSTTEAQQGSQSMNYAYTCGSSPYWSEAYIIFPTDQDWSMYDTFGMWVKGKTSSQSLEDMYFAVYKAKVPSPVDHSDLELLGKARFYNVTRKSEWTYWRADMDFDFESIASVRAVGIGMTPTSYGSGVIQIDSIAVDNTGLGGVIDNFETYTDTNDLLSDANIISKYGDNCEIYLVNEPNVYDGNNALRVDVNYGMDPYWAKVMFKDSIRHLGYNWNAKGYNPLTVHFKVANADGSIQVALIDNFGSNAAVFYYNDGNRVPEGDWIRWDIDIREVLDTDPYALDDIRRVDVQFIAEDYGLGVVYLDDIYVNVCGTGAYGVGGLTSNIYDYDGDCRVDFQDYAVFALYWLETGCTSPDYCEGADFLIDGSRDGQVNGADAAVMLNEWLECNLLYDGDCY